MRKYILILILLLHGSHYSVAQKTIQKEFSSEEIHTLSIKDDAIYKITIQSSKSSEITFKVHISGEHSESVIIEEKLSEGKLSLKTGFVPFFTLENDKLAAHKVMAIEIELIIPETITIEIKSKLASVYTIGNIKNLNVALEYGNCVLSNFSGNAHLKTDAGNIKVRAQNNVSGSAISKLGTIENTLSNFGKFHIEAESNNGDISLIQME